MIDALALAKELRNAGDSPEKAEAIAGAINRALETHVATKDDLRQLGEKLDAKIAKGTLTLFIALTGVIAIATGLLLAFLHR
ncbi:MAG: hypothetical protein ACYDFS_06415 [Vulcanimicrobiaceae bacterium]